MLTLRPAGLSSPAYRDWLDYVIVENRRNVGRPYEAALNCGGFGRSRSTSIPSSASQRAAGRQRSSARRSNFAKAGSACMPSKRKPAKRSKGWNAPLAHCRLL
jgi:hypothetical protein